MILKTYLVTGSEGFIGNSVRERIISTGDFAICIERDFVLKNDLWKKSLSDLFASYRFDGVFHIGACADTMSKNVNEMMLLNYEFTTEIADLCKDNDVKLVFSSSAACYGSKDLPQNLYAWSKYCAENYLVSIGKGVNLRYFNVFGPGEHNKGRMASVAHQAFVSVFLNKEIDKMTLFPGNPKRDFVHICDVVEANIHAMSNINEGTVWDVGSGTPISFETVMDIFGISYSYSGQEAIPEGYQFYTCSDKKRWMPGWKPKDEIKSRFKSYKDHLFKKHNIIKKK